jgi:hypothetical protein
MSYKYYIGKFLQFFGYFLELLPLIALILSAPYISLFLSAPVLFVAILIFGMLFYFGMVLSTFGRSLAEVDKDPSKSKVFQRKYLEFMFGKDAMLYAGTDEKKDKKKDSKNSR